MFKTRSLIAGITILILLTCKLPLYAAENTGLPDLTRTGSITIRFIDSDTGKGFSFGNKVGLFKVANAVEDEGYRYEYDELFESVGDPPETADEMNSDLAGRLLETAEYKGISLDMPSEELSEDGKVTFGGIEPGLYLVSQTHRGTDSPRYQVEPFLVTVPVVLEDGTFLYDVAVTYKTGTGEVGTVKIEVNDGAVMADTSLVPVQEKTENGRWIPIAVIIVIAAAVIIIFAKQKK